MATIERGTILVARQSFVVWDGGRMVPFRRGRTTIREGHRLLKGHEDRFAPLVVTHDLEETSSPLEIYAQLRTRAKELGLPATGKAVELEAAIAKAERSASRK
jgi:hypothetical protein